MVLVHKVQRQVQARRAYLLSKWYSARFQRISLRSQDIYREKNELAREWAQ